MNLLLKPKVDKKEFILDDLYVHAPQQVGSTALLNDILEGKITIVKLFRRFGCPMTRHDAKELSKYYDHFQEIGVELVGIGFDVEGATDFIIGDYWKGQLYLDPDYEIYKYFNLGRMNHLESISKAFWTGTQAASNLMLDGNMKGDGCQLGGTFCIDMNLRSFYSYRQEWPTCFAPIPEIIDSCQRIIGSELTQPSDDEVDWDAFEEGLEEGVNVLSPTFEHHVELEEKGILSKTIDTIYDGTETTLNFIPNKLCQIGTNLKSLDVDKTKENIENTLLFLPNKLSQLTTNLKSIDVEKKRDTIENTLFFIPNKFNQLTSSIRASITDKNKISTEPASTIKHNIQPDSKLQVGGQKESLATSLEDFHEPKREFKANNNDLSASLKESDSLAEKSLWMLNFEKQNPDLVNRPSRSKARNRKIEPEPKSEVDFTSSTN